MKSNFTNKFNSVNRAVWGTRLSLGKVEDKQEIEARTAKGKQHSRQIAGKKPPLTHIETETENEKIKR